MTSAARTNRCSGAIASHGGLDRRVGLGRGRAGDQPDGVEELLGRHPLDLGTAEDVAVGRVSLRGDRRARLVRPRVDDVLDQRLEVVAVVDEVRRQVVEQVLAPGLVGHHVDRMDDAAAHQPLPDPVDDRPREPAVVGVRHQPASCSSRLSRGWAGVDRPQLGPEELRHGDLAGRLVAAGDLQRPLGDHGRQAVGVVELPAVDEAVVARGALHVDAEEHLRDVLRELDLADLAGVDPAPPLDALDEPLRLGRRADQLADEPVVGLVVEQRPIEPAGDLLAAAVDVAGAGVVVAEQVVPEGQPVIGVGPAVVEQRGGQPRRLSGPVSFTNASSSPAGGSRPITSRNTRRANAASSRGSGGGDLVRGEIGVDDAVDRVVAAARGREGAWGAGASTARRSRAA